MRIVVVKANRFEAESVLTLTRGLYPEADVLLCALGREAVQLLSSAPTDLALVGLTLTDMDGLDLIQLISMDRKVSRILVLADRFDEHAAQVLSRMRVEGCFDSLGQGSAELTKAIQAVAEGGTYFGRGWWEIRRRSEPKSALLRQILSATELEVFAVIGDGADDQQAAAILGLSSKTIHTHRQRIMRKLEVRTRAELMVTAIQRGVVRYTHSGVIRPGLEQTLEERRSRSRDPFGSIGAPRTDLSDTASPCAFS